MNRLAFKNANIVDMTRGVTVPSQTVIICGNRIESLGPTDEIEISENTICIDAMGKTLIPGLVDMHVHIIPSHLSGNLDEAAALARASAYLQVFLTAGVTTVRNMAGTPLHLKLRQMIAEEKLVGPRIFSSGPILESRFTFPELQEYGQLVTTISDAREIVRLHKAQGYDFIKVYNDIDAEIYDAIICTARQIGIPVIGHVAFDKGLQGALAAKQDSIEHLRSYDFAVDTRTDKVKAARFEGWLHATHRRIEELAEMTADAGVWNAPTLVIEHNIRTDEELENAIEPLPSFIPEWMANEFASDNTESIFSREQRETLSAGRAARGAMVSALDRVDAGVLAGSDCPGCRLVPGRSLIQEIELLVAAGLSPWRALRTATVNAAKFLGKKDEGKIIPGYRADLVLLDADPLENIAALHANVGVVLNGRWLPRTAVEQMICGH